MTVLLRKARTGATLLARFVRRAASRARNVALKRARHAAKRAQWTWRGVREDVKNARLGTVNLAWLLVERTWNLRKPVIRFRRRRKRTAEVAAQLREERRIERATLSRAGRSRPLVLGPWISEVGFEVLYWIPFLTWLRSERAWDPATTIAVSRGGVRSWYAGLADRYVDVFERWSPEEFARLNDARRDAADGTQKQMGLSALDRELVAFACEQTGLSDPEIIHPSTMYRLFRHFWLGNRPISHVLERTRATRRTGPPGPDLPGLPADYVAVKAYTAQSLPDLPRNRRALAAVVEHLAEITDVVTLDTGLRLDDHEDYRLDGHRRVFNLKGLMSPQNNLEVQTQVIARARAFVGTCGALTWLAPMLGVPTVALMSDTKFLRAHLYFARQVYADMDAAPFSTVDVTALDALELTTGLDIVRPRGM